MSVTFWPPVTLWCNVETTVSSTALFGCSFTRSTLKVLASLLHSLELHMHSFVLKLSNSIKTGTRSFFFWNPKIGIICNTWKQALLTIPLQEKKKKKITIEHSAMKFTVLAMLHFLKLAQGGWHTTNRKASDKGGNLALYFFCCKLFFSFPNF